MVDIPTYLHEGTLFILFEIDHSVAVIEEEVINLLHGNGRIVWSMGTISALLPSSDSM